jgi:hypothetical protein
MVVFADPVNVTLTGVEGASNGTYAISPYYLSINGAAPIDAFCVDFNHESYIGASWTANVSLVSGSTFENTYQGNQTAYLEMGYLASIYKTAIAAEQVYIQQAIWDISVGNNGTPPYTDESTKVWISQAMTNYNTWTTSGWVILTDTQGITTGTQEFLTQGPVATPEPGTIMLLGSGILGIYGFSRKKRTQLKT